MISFLSYLQCFRLLIYCATPCQNFQACLNQAEVLNLHFCFRPEIFAAAAAAAARCLLRIVVYIVWIESIYHSESESAEANCWIFFDFDGDKCFLSFCESSLSTVENFYFLFFFSETRRRILKKIFKNNNFFVEFERRSKFSSFYRNETRYLIFLLTNFSCPTSWSHPQSLRFCKKG